MNAQNHNHIALEYLHRLHKMGYFGNQQEFKHGPRISNHPACAADDTWQETQNFLISNGFIKVIKEGRGEIIDYRDYMPFYWFILTPKGKQYIESWK
jgi:hypothetical protein